MGNRTEKITFRLTPSELEQLLDKAKKANMKVSEYIRQSLLDKEIIVVDGIDGLIKEVNAIGRNLNQLTVLCHQGKITCPNIDKVEMKLDDVWKLLNLLTIKTRRKKS